MYVPPWLATESGLADIFNGFEVSSVCVFGVSLVMMDGTIVTGSV